MDKQNYNYRIRANVKAKEAFDAISRVSEWWATDFTGSSKKLNDVFTVHFGETSVTFKITEYAPGKKIEWLVTDCYLQWLKDVKEWKDTRLRFEITEGKKLTQINFTHFGLVPGLECYSDCNAGWNFHVGVSLFKLITEHKGIPDINTRVENVN
jgi:hypothetical protein